MAQPTTLRATMVAPIPPTRAHSARVRPLRIRRSATYGLTTGAPLPTPPLRNPRNSSSEATLLLDDSIRDPTGPGAGAGQAGSPPRPGGVPPAHRSSTLPSFQ